MTVLRFMDGRPTITQDGEVDFDHQSHVRCTCPDRANLVAKVREGDVAWAGCPVCGREAIVEVLPDGEIGFFPMGVRMF